MSVVGTITVGRLKYRLARINLIVGVVLFAAAAFLAVLTSLANRTEGFAFTAFWLGALSIVGGCVAIVAFGRAIDFWERGR